MPTRMVVGLLGGGQLGRMLQEAAALVGVEIVVLDQAGCPTKQICQNSNHVDGSFNDADKIRELAAKCDVLTIEIEHVNTDVLEEIATRGVLVGPGERKKVPVHPSWETIRLIQDKYLQKEHYARAGLPIAQQLAIDRETSVSAALQDAARKLGFPFMLKARKGSYDGRGNFKIGSEQDIVEAAASIGKLDLYAEKWASFEKELSVIVVRTEDPAGNLSGLHPYPAVETIHEDSICTKVFFPPRQVSPEICKRAERLATDVVKTLKGRGVFAIEMFLLSNEDILINEVAPRPHNSGHLFIEALPYMSQFKAQLYSVLDMFPPAIKLEPRVSSAIMLNILGGGQKDSHEPLIDLANSLYDAKMDIFLHLYGKASKPGRKIGHITTTAYGEHSDLEQSTQPLIKAVDEVRKSRLEPVSIQSPSSVTPATLNGTPRVTSSRNIKAPVVIITMGSDSDLPVLRAAFDILEKFEVPYDYTITSAHRTPHRMVELGKSADARGVRVLIAAAGGAAHLPGMLASETPLPVIGVPIKATHLDGHDSLLSIVQMPRGCPVATVGINNSTNAALLAVKILGSSEKRYRHAMADYMKGMSDEVEEKAARLQNLGWRSYLDER